MSWGNLGGRPGRPLPADSAIPITIALIYGSACLTVAALSSLLGGGVLQVSPLPDSATVRLGGAEVRKGHTFGGSTGFRLPSATGYFLHLSGGKGRWEVEIGWQEGPCPGVEVGSNPSVERMGIFVSNPADRERNRMPSPL